MFNLSSIYLISVRPVYKTSGSIIIEDENSTMSSIFDMESLLMLIFRK